MNAQLVGRIRKGITETFKVRGDEVVLGREPGQGIAIPAEGVSRNHARIVWDGKTHWIEDLKSTNGTFLNGTQVTRERLRHLDVVTLGRKVDLIFVIRDERAAPAVREGILRAILIPEDADSTPYEIPVGETSLGRSPTANVATESGAVSKMHARIERTADQLMIQDLGSSNGTFVNGARVTVSSLQHGDVVSLAGVVNYRVEVERGQVAGSGIYKAPALKTSGTPETPRYSEEWKTRMDWSSGERELIAEFRDRLAAADVERAATGKTPVTPPTPPAGSPAKRVVPAADRTDPPVRSQTTAPVKAAAPAAAAPPAKAAAPASASPPPKAAAPAPSVAPSKVAPPVPPPPAAAAAPAPPLKPPAPPAPPPAPSAPPAAARSAPEEEAPTLMSPKALVTIREVRLTGRDTTLSVTAPGSYDIGRSRDVALRVSDATVSRRHARIILADDRRTAWVEHAGGANGTRLNGAPVLAPQPLSDGDSVDVGELPLKVTIVRG
ncbi:MAG TPA: FHA domain-containing protein [Vicinamibacteria bacterium]|nr:FHA domain-containing protein [Vicinamibacteria bacterium]